MASKPKDDEKISPRNHRGRPSVNQQLKMEEEIMTYFVGFISATVASNELGMDRKTVDKYYEKFAVRRQKINEEAFIKECKINIESADTAISLQILESLRSQKELRRLKKDLLLKKKYSLKEFLSLQAEDRRISKNIAYLIAVKLNIVNATTGDITLGRLVKEHSDKFVN